MSGGQGEISVAIKGTDTLSPALQRVHTNLERSRIALQASGAVAETYAKKIADVQAKYATGEIDAIKYERGLNRIEKEFKETTAAVTQYQTATTAAAGTTNQMMQANTNATRGATRLVFGVQAMSVALQGGRVSAQGLISALTMLGIGSPSFLIITAGLSVIGGLLLNMENRGDKAASAIERATEAARAGVAGIDSEVGLQNTIRELEARARTQISTYQPATGESASETEQVATTAAQGLTPAEAARLSAAQDRLRELRRNRSRSGARGRGFRFGSDPWMSLADDMAQMPAFNPQNPMSRALFGLDRSPAIDPKAFEKIDPLGESLKSGPLDNSMKSIDLVIAKLDEGSAAARAFGGALSEGFGAAIDAAASGGNAIEALVKGTIAGIAKEARVKAIFELAEGFASIFNPGKGGPAGAATHFKAAALYGSIAIGAGALAGGGGGGGGRAGGGGGGSGGFGGRHSSENPFRDAGRDARPIQIIQFVTADGREISRQVVATNAREERLGARPLANVTRFPLNGIVLDGPVTRAGV